MQASFPIKKRAFSISLNTCSNVNPKANSCSYHWIYNIVIWKHCDWGRGWCAGVFDIYLYVHMFWTSTTAPASRHNIPNAYIQCIQHAPWAETFSVEWLLLGANASWWAQEDIQGGHNHWIYFWENTRGVLKTHIRTDNTMETKGIEFDLVHHCARLFPEWLLLYLRISQLYRH